jgi:hypothetical protein
MGPSFAVEAVVRRDVDPIDVACVLSTAHCAAGSIALGEGVGGEHAPKLVRILVGHFTAGCTFRLMRKRVSGS